MHVFCFEFPPLLLSPLHVKASENTGATTVRENAKGFLPLFAQWWHARLLHCLRFFFLSFFFPQLKLAAVGAVACLSAACPSVTSCVCQHIRSIMRRVIQNRATGSVGNCNSQLQ